MIFHASIPARDPVVTAAMLAELTGGTAYPFPPVRGGFIVFTGAGNGHALEIYPAGVGVAPGGVETAAGTRRDGVPGETHIALGVPKSEAEIRSIARQAGWTCETCDRGGFFQVVELWIDGTFLIEALTPEMQRAYAASMTPENWAKTFGFANAA